MQAMVYGPIYMEMDRRYIELVETSGGACYMTLRQLIGGCTESEGERRPSFCRSKIVQFNSAKRASIFTDINNQFESN
jgi:hypothetical protein